MMTRKHFEAIAQIINEHLHEEHWPEKPWLERTSIGSARAFSEALADFFATESPRFDQDQFLKACGVEQ